MPRRRPGRRRHPRRRLEPADQRRRRRAPLSPPSWTAAFPDGGLRRTPERPRPASARPGTWSSGSGPGRSSGRADCRPGAAARVGSTASGRSSRRSATWSFATDRVGTAGCPRRPVPVGPAHPASGPVCGTSRGRAARPRRAALARGPCSSLRHDRMATVRQVVDGLTALVAGRATPRRRGRRAGRSPAATRCAPVCGRSSTRSGNTASTPSATWPSWETRDPADPAAA